jgi:hypothetical protein
MTAVLQLPDRVDDSEDEVEAEGDENDELSTS